MMSRTDSVGATPLQVFGLECLECTLGRPRSFGKGRPQQNSGSERATILSDCSGSQFAGIAHGTR
jgi:hypothetical protein